MANLRQDEAYTPKLSVEEIIEKINIIDMGFRDMYFLETELEFIRLDGFRCEKSIYISTPSNPFAHNIIDIYGLLPFAGCDSPPPVTYLPFKENREFAEYGLTEYGEIKLAGYKIGLWWPFKVEDYTFCLCGHFNPLQLHHITEMSQCEGCKRFNKIFGGSIYSRGCYHGRFDNDSQPLEN